MEPKKKNPKQIQKLAWAKSLKGKSTCSSTEVASLSKIANKPRRSAQVSEPSDNERTNTTIEVFKKTKLKVLKKLRHHIDIEDFEPLPEQGKRLLRDNRY